jgi:hypothetical protein
VLDTIGDDDVQLDRLQTLEFTTLDRAHLRVVEGLAKPERVLGPHVSAVLRAGRKIALFKAALKVAGQRGR